jgi:hypothetical protein
MPNKKYSTANRFLNTFLVIFLFISTIYPVIVIPANRQFIEVEVKAILDCQEVIAKYDIEFDEPTIVCGNLTCNITEGMGDVYLYVEVNLGLKDDLNWSPAINPHKFIFNSSGVERFNITFYVPCEEDNRTVNRIRVIGSWVVKPFIREPLAKGSVEQDYVDAIVYRKSAVRGGTSVKGPDDPIDEPIRLLEVLGPEIIPLIAVPGIIIFFYISKKREKRKIEFRKQALDELRRENKL